MKKSILLCAVLMMAWAGAALAADAKLTGKVTAVDGDMVTIEVEKGKGSEVAVGADVDVMVKEKKAEKKAPKKGGDMLQGC